MSRVTCDSLWNGRLILWQPARGQGYRFNLDPVLLANFAAPGDHVVDLGAGCGVVGLMLLAMGKAERVTAVEVQPELAELARRNARENGLEERYTVLTGDLRDQHFPEADRVVFNPPYYPLSSTRGSPDVGRDHARREHHGTLQDFTERSLGALKDGGTAAAIVPIARGDELRNLWRDAGGHPIRRRHVMPRAGAPAQHVLLETRASQTPQRAFQEEAGLILHTDEGRTFTDEVARWVSGPQSWQPATQAPASSAGPERACARYLL
jgi:tRNA1Val (adenine37-N6)-methyltransferase